MPNGYLKREDLNHTGAHKVNNTVGQALLAKRMGKTRIIAETGAGQHGVAAATVAARLGLEALHVDARTFQVRLQQVAVADLLARFDPPVVDTGIADQLLQQLDGLVGQRWIGVVELAHGSDVTTAHAPRMASRRSWSQLHSHGYGERHERGN